MPEKTELERWEPTDARRVQTCDVPELPAELLGSAMAAFDAAVGLRPLGDAAEAKRKSEYTADSYDDGQQVKVKVINRKLKGRPCFRTYRVSRARVDDPNLSEQIELKTRLEEDGSIRVRSAEYHLWRRKSHEEQVEAELKYTGEVSEWLEEGGNGYGFCYGCKGHGPADTHLIGQLRDDVRGRTAIGSFWLFENDRYLEDESASATTAP